MRAHPRGAKLLGAMALHIDIPTQAADRRAARRRATPSVSIYLPTSPLPQDAEAARIEFKNLAAEGDSPGRGARAPCARPSREHFDDLYDDEEFWTRLAISLAVFATPGGVRTFRLPNRLTSLVEVSDRFHLKPLLRSVTFPQAAFVLALAQGSVRLIEIANDLPAAEVAVAELPNEIAGAVGKAPITDRPPSGGSTAPKARRSGCASTRGRSTARCARCWPARPAADPRRGEPLDAIYRSVNSYPHLAAHVDRGQPGDRLRGRAGRGGAAILDALYAAELAELRERFETRG